MSQVEAYYNADPQLEWERHQRHRTEFAVTLRALREYLPPAPARVADIGGGPGYYAVELAHQGYHVTLLDLSAANIALGRQKAAEAGVTLAASLTGNALHLDGFADRSYDAVLLLGPLYHLLSEEDRRQAVREALRILRPGGLLFAAFITRFAPVRDDAVRLAMLDDHKELFRELWASGINPPGTDFTEAYFAHPAEVVPFMESCGMETRLVVGVEGVAAGHEARINQLSGSAFDNWTEINYLLGQEPSLWGASDHLLYIGAGPAAEGA